MSILFLEDWQNYPGAIVDTSTKNQSFIRYAALLKAMGVKNHAFPLQLHNPELQGVDPYSPDLTREQMLYIALECRENVFYFLREIARDPKGTPDEPIPFRANRGNMALFWLFFNHITLILIQIRQTGKSFSTDVLMTYLLNIRCKKTEINLLTKDDTLRAANLERLKNIQGELPFYLKQKHRGDIGNTEELSVKALGNRYRGHVPNKSPKMALNVGRGLTSPIFQIDEAAFLYNIAISMPAALAAGTAERDRADRLGEPYGTILTTTSGKIDDPDGAYVYNLVQNSAIWNEAFMDARNLEELRNIIRRNSPKGALRVNCTFNHRQLGYTDEWLKTAIEQSEAKGDDANRDFGNVWTSGSLTSPLTTAILAVIRSSQRTNPYIEISHPHGYVTNWFVDKDNIDGVMNNGHHILSIDSSDAAGGDDISMHLRCIRSGATVASGTYNETNIITFSEWLCSWFIRFEKVTLIIERRSTGSSIIDYLLLLLPSKGIDPFKRIYNRCVQDADEDMDRYKEISKPIHMRDENIYIKHKKTFGFATSAAGATSRTELYSTTLQNAAKLTGDKIYDERTINQILTLIIKNGRVDHPPGGNDDCVISWILSGWLLLSGKNLNHYGINTRDILSDNKVNQEINDPVKLYEYRFQNKIKQDIEELVELIRKERDQFLAQRYESKLKSLAAQLNQEDRTILAVDALLEKLREEKSFSNGARYGRY